MIKKTAKEKVLNSRTNLYAKRDDDGKFFIQDALGDNILEEYLLPNTNTEEEAWESAKLTLETTQHFNRTHPEKILSETSEMTAYRVNRRRLKKKKLERKRNRS